MTKNEDKSPFINRELSWLKFNERVLEEAEDKNNPLYERLKFVSIFTSNLDEFFMIRVGSLHDQSILETIMLDNKTGMTPKDQLSAIYSAVNKLLPRRSDIFDKLAAEMRSIGIDYITAQRYTEEDIEYLWAYFRNEIQPLLSPQIIDKQHPFPFLKNLETYVGVQLYTKGNYLRFGLIPAGDGFRRVIKLPGEGMRFCLVEDVISYFTDKVFKKYKVIDRVIFRITRNADINVQEGLFDEDVDYRDTMQELIYARRKLCAVRLELCGSVNRELQKYICKKLSLTSSQVFENTAPLDMSFIFASEDPVKKMRPSIFYQPIAPRHPHYINPTEPMLPQVEDHDILLCYPFDSMDHFIRLLNEAATDTNVISIKITLYRVATNSRVIDALIRAANLGKQVFAVVELRARFDEQHNIDWAAHLEEAGVNISYGLDDYKTHSKLLLITRRKDDGVEYITQVGTGNYNEKTAKLYTDMALITANQDVGRDAAEFYRNISLGETTTDTQSLIIAPDNFRSVLIDLIHEQAERAKAGLDSEIIIKINSLTDKDIMNALIKASKAGVPIRMIIRGICCLKPGIPGKTENIEVISIVGRLLEHSRIYSFGPEKRMYISSGDLMTRSTERRVEIGIRIYDARIRDEIYNMLCVMLRDNVKARRGLPDGSYKRVKAEGHPPLESQIYFFNN